jgi:hypothetical protein
MIHAMIDGQRGAKQLAQLAKGRMRPKISLLEQALTGRFDDHHALLAAKMLDRIERLDADIAALDAEVRRASQPYHDQISRLADVDGFGQRGAEVILAELGADMSCFPTPANLVSWAKRCPSINQSGARSKPAATGQGNKHLARQLGISARAAAKTRSFLGAKYRRIAKRRGNLKAEVAVSNAMLTIAWHILADPQAHYIDLARTGTTAASTRTPKPADWSPNSNASATRSPSNPSPPSRPYHPPRPPDPDPPRPQSTRLRCAGCCRLPTQPRIFGSAVVLDAGELRILPPPPGCPPPLPRTVRSGCSAPRTAQTHSLISQLTVAYGTVSLAPDLRSGAGSGLANWPAWIVIYSSPSNFECGAPVDSTAADRRRHIFALDAVVGKRAIAYQVGTPACQPPAGQSKVSIAQQYISVPWVEAGRNGRELTLRYQADGCRMTVSTQAKNTAQGWEISVIEGRPIQAADCPHAQAGAARALLPSAGLVAIHAPVGPVTTLYTNLHSPRKFDYFDGSS